MPAQYSKVFVFSFWIALICSYVLALLPQDMAPSVAELSDKSLHFLAFAILTLLINLAYKIKWWKSALYMLFCGVFIEFSQYFTPNRCVEFLDVVADSIGIIIGLIGYLAYKKIEAIRENR